MSAAQVLQVRGAFSETHRDIVHWFCLNFFTYNIQYEYDNLYIMQVSVVYTARYHHKFTTNKKAMLWQKNPVSHIYCKTECAMAVQGHSRSLILVPIKSACAVSYH